MLLRLFIPLIVITLLKSLSVLSQSADTIFANYTEDYQRVACARYDVYRRNLQEGFDYLKGLYPYLEESYPNVLNLIQRMAQGNSVEKSCSPIKYAVFREMNAKLPLKYPNWNFLEDAGGDEGRSGEGEYKDEDNDRE